MSEHTGRQTETTFVSGLDLCEFFYHEAVEPILRQEFGSLRYAAALIGSGSEVLGFDTEMSADHHWGPRVMLFAEEADVEKHESAIRATLSDRLPRRFRGYPTSYTPVPDDHGVQLLDYSEEGPINHRVAITSIRAWFNDYLGFDVNNLIAPADWLTFPEQKLLSITSGRVYRDDVGLESARRRFTYYPHDVWLYLLAAGWTRIEQEEHLMGRAGIVGDEIGSALIGSRLVRDLMRLCFLMEKRYAPYPKWFGTAFKQLQASPRLEPILKQVLSATDWKARERYLSQAYEYIAQVHARLEITSALPTAVVQFHDRPFNVISMGVFSKAIAGAIEDPAVKKIAKGRLIGAIDQFSDSTDIGSDPGLRPALRNLFVDR